MVARCKGVWDDARQGRGRWTGGWAKAGGGGVWRDEVKPEAEKATHVNNGEKRIRVTKTQQQQQQQLYNNVVAQAAAAAAAMN